MTGDLFNIPRPRFYLICISAISHNTVKMLMEYPLLMSDKEKLSCLIETAHLVNKGGYWARIDICYLDDNGVPVIYAQLP